MAWVRIDDQIGRHPKFLQAGPAASWLWVLAIAHSQSRLTDGFISELVLPLLGIPRGFRSLAERLVAVGLFEHVEGGYLVHDYLEYNPRRDDVLERRAQDLHRKRGEFQTDSRRNPRGFQPESSRNPDGIRPDSTRNAKSDAIPPPAPPLSPRTPLSPSLPPPEGKELYSLSARNASRSEPPASEKNNGKNTDNSAINAFLRRFAKHYAAALHGAKYLQQERDKSLVRRLLHEHGPERLEQLAIVMLNADDKYIAESDRGIQILSTKINWLESRLRAAEART